MKLKQKWAKMTFSLDYNLKIFFSGGLTFGGKGIKFSGVEVYWGGRVFSGGGIREFLAGKGGLTPILPSRENPGLWYHLLPFFPLTALRR